MIQLLEIITCSSLFIWLIYELISMIKISGYKPESGSTEHPVSVIVCAHNELNNLKRLIPKILDQQHTNFELIIVDDRSDDGTYDYLLEAQSEQLKLVRVDQVHDHINAKKYALTLGIKAAKNDILLHTDADCEPASELWIQSMTNRFNTDTQFVLGVSQYQKNKGFLSHFIRFETIKTAINYVGFALAGNPYMGVGRNLAYRKSYFLANKGFNKIQHITGGDDDLLINQYATKGNTQLALGNDALTYSHPKESWSDYRFQKTRHWAVGKFYSAKDKILLGLQNLANLIFWVSLIILATQTEDYILPIGLFVFRLLFVTILNKIASKKFGDRMNIWIVPILDILYVGYASLFGTAALLTKKVKWKK